MLVPTAAYEPVARSYPNLIVDTPGQFGATVRVHLDAVTYGGHVAPDSCPHQDTDQVFPNGVSTFRATFDLAPGGACAPVDSCSAPNPPDKCNHVTSPYWAVVLRFEAVFSQGLTPIVTPYDIASNRIALAIEDRVPANDGGFAISDTAMLGSIPDNRYQPAPGNQAFPPVYNDAVVLLPRPKDPVLAFGRAPVPLATWLYDKADAARLMRILPAPSRFTVSCDSLAGPGEGDELELLDAELQLAAAAGCNTVRLVGFDGLPNQAVSNVEHFRLGALVQHETKTAEMDVVTTSPDDGRGQFAFVLHDYADFFRDPCFGAACDAFQQFSFMKSDFEQANHLAHFPTTAPAYVAWSDEVSMFYPASRLSDPAEHRYGTLPGRLQWVNPNVPGGHSDFANFLANSSGLTPQDFGAAPGLTWPYEPPIDPGVDAWFKCAGASFPRPQECAGQPAQLPLTQRHLLYWIMEYLQYSWAAGETWAKYVTHALGWGQTAVVRDQRVQPVDILPYRLWGDSQYHLPAVELWANWKRHGAVGENWTEYHHADWQLNSLDLNLAIMQSSVLNVEQPLRCQGNNFDPSCWRPDQEFHRTGGSMALAGAGGASTPMQNGHGNLYRFLSAIGHGATFLELYTLGPLAFFNTDDNAWSDNSLSTTMSSAIDAIQRSEDVMSGAQRDRPIAAIVMPTFSSALWNYNSEWSRYDFEIAGLYFALAHNGVDVDFIDDRDIVQWPGFWRPPEGLGRYSVVYVASPYLTGAAKASLLQWVQSGGVLALTPGAASLDEYGDFDDTLYSAYFAAAGVSESSYACCVPPPSQMCDPTARKSTDCTGPLAAAWEDARAAFKPPIALWDADPLKGTAPLVGVPIAAPGRVVVDDHLPWNPFGVTLSTACLPTIPGGPCPANEAGSAIKYVHPAPANWTPTPLFPPPPPGTSAPGSIALFRFYPGSSYLYSTGGGTGGWGHCGTFGRGDGCASTMPVGWDPSLADLAWQPHNLVPAWRQSKPLATAYFDLAHPEVPAPGIEVLTWRCPWDSGGACGTPGAIGVVLLNFRGDFGQGGPQKIAVRVDNVVPPGLIGTYWISPQLASSGETRPRIQADQSGGITVSAIATPDAEALLLRPTLDPLIGPNQ